MASVLLVGSTRLIGSHILTQLSSNPSITAIHSIGRRAPLQPNTKLTPIVEADTAKWASAVSSLIPSPTIYISGLGTTKAVAGGIENQRKIDLDLNLALATAAKAAGVKTFVLISAANVSSSSSFAYPKMKGELEDAVTGLGFEKTVFVKPGMIIGNRETSKPLDGVMGGLAWFTGVISGGKLRDIWAADADVIARAAIIAGLEAVEGKGPQVRHLGHAEIVQLGKLGN